MLYPAMPWRGNQMVLLNFGALISGGSGKYPALSDSAFQNDAPNTERRASLLITCHEPAAVPDEPEQSQQAPGPGGVEVM